MTAMAPPLLRVERLAKRYTRGLLQSEVTFALTADFTVDGPGVIGVMGPNGSGKTTLFELITGGNAPTAGRVLVNGQDIHAVRYREREGDFGPQQPARVALGEPFDTKQRRGHRPHTPSHRTRLAASSRSSPAAPS